MWARIVVPRICILTERGFVRVSVHACVCQVGACVKLLSNILIRMLVLALVVTSLYLILLQNSRPIGAILIILGLLRSFVDISPASRVLVAFCSLAMTLGQCWTIH